MKTRIDDPDPKFEYPDDPWVFWGIIIGVFIAAVAACGFVLLCAYAISKLSQP